MIDRESPGILIYGAGGQAKVAWDAICKERRFRPVAFISDDCPPGEEQRLFGLPIIPFPSLHDHRAALPSHFLVAIGDNAARQAKFAIMESLGFQAATIMHPSVCLGHEVQIGRGSFLSAGVIIDAEVTLGEGALLNVGAAIGHETRVGRFAHIGPRTIIGARCEIGDMFGSGMGALIISGLSAGRNCFLAAGALVTKNVPDDCLALGAPARVRSRAPVAANS